MQVANVVALVQRLQKVILFLYSVSQLAFNNVKFQLLGDGQKMVKKEGENNVAEAGENISSMETEAK